MTVVLVFLALLVPAGEPGPPNLLLVIGDDIGTDRIAAYGEHEDAGPTPGLDRMAADGVLFRNAYANPLCSPTRMTILTGRYGFRTGIGKGVPWQSDPTRTFEPSPGEVTLPEVLAATHAVAAVGKWHLAAQEGFGYQHPVEFGFDLFSGSRGNLGGAQTPPVVYFEWEKNVATPAGNTQFTQRAYATTDAVDDTLSLIRRFGEQPWAICLSFHAAHTPYHIPPDDLTTIGVTGLSSNARKHRAAVEALDSELQRLIESLGQRLLARTWIVFVGDNGTPGGAISAPFSPSKAKGTVYERGVRVPLIVRGPGVRAPGRPVEALVNTTDLFATLVELAGVQTDVPDDSISLVPYLDQPGHPSLRRWVFAERFSPNGFGPYVERQRALRSGRYKLIVRDGTDLPPSPPPVEFFDLQTDPLETENLLPVAEFTPEQRRAYGHLQRVLADLTAE